MTKSEGARQYEDSFWMDGETLLKLDGFKPSSFREAPNATPVYDLKVLEGGALRRRLRQLGSQELAPPVPQASRMRGV
jgi:hypothetical protein